MTMDTLTSILEEEFALDFDVKDEKALKRSLTLLTGNMVSKEDYQKETNTVSSEIKSFLSDVKILAVKMEEGFKVIDTRLAAHDKRFDSMDACFNRLTGLISLGFIVMTVLITVYQFLT